MTHTTITKTSLYAIILMILSIGFLVSCKTYSPSTFTTSGEIMVYSTKEAQRKINSGKYSKVILGNGVYNDVEINLTKKLSNTTLAAQTPGGVVITGKSKINFSGNHIVLKDFLFFNIKEVDKIINIKDAFNCRITNCAFIDCGTPYTNQTTFEGGLITYLDSNSKNNRIDHCYWDGSFGICLAIGYQTSYESPKTSSDRVNRNNRIDSCYVKNISEWAEIKGKPLNGNDPFMIGWGYFPYAPNSNNIVQYNLFENISSDSEIISVKLSNTTIANNTFLESPKTKYQSPQLILRTGNNSIVRDNYFINTGAGITVHGNGHQIFNNYIDTDYLGIHLPGGKKGEYSYPGQNSCNITNNTIINTQYPFMFGKKGWNIKPGNKGNNSIHNNTVYIDNAKLSKSYNKPVLFYDNNNNSASRINWENNTVFTSNRYNYTITRQEKFMSDYNLNTSNIEAINPEFEIDEIGLYKLKPDSRLKSLKKGIGSISKTLDLAENNSVEHLDVGNEAYLPIASSYNKPLQPSDVGPLWISDYTNFKKELIDHWKKWKVDDFVTDSSPAYISTPFFNSSTPILQLDLSDAQGFDYKFNSKKGKHILSCTDIKPRVVAIPIQDYNENNLPNSWGDTTVAYIENWVVKKSKCSKKITVIGNGEKIQFLNDLKLPMNVHSIAGSPVTVTHGESLLLEKDKTYFVSAINGPIGNISSSKKTKRCKVTYTIKPISSGVH